MPPLGVGSIVTIPQIGHNLVGRIQNYNLAPQIRDHHFAITLVEVAGHLSGSFNEVNVLAFKSEALQPLIRAVGYNQQWSGGTGVNPQAVRAIELSGVFTAPPESSDKFSTRVVLIDITGAIAISDVDIAIGSDGNVGGIVAGGAAVGRFVGGRFRRISQREH